MDIAIIHRIGTEWMTEVVGVKTFAARSLIEATRDVGHVIREARALPASSSPGVQFKFPDEFMGPAMAVARDRVQLRSLERRVLEQTVEQVGILTREGLAGGDIGTILGISPGRVSQILKTSD